MRLLIMSILLITYLQASATSWYCTSISNYIINSTTKPTYLFGWARDNNKAIAVKLSKTTCTNAVPSQFTCDTPVCREEH